MELNENTLQVLKNFSTINPSLLIPAGSELTTMSESKTIVSTANIDQEFPMQVGIYDLNEFLSVLSLVDTPRLKFTENFVTVGAQSGRARIKYFYCDPSMINASNAKNIVMPEADVSFTLSADTLNRIKKASSVLGHGQVSVSVQDSVACLSILDSEDKTSNSFSIDVDGEYQNEDFNFIWSIENWKFIPGDYQVTVSSKMISHFVNKENNVEYWVALKL
jgi:hypothetical protein